jgi:DNA uptake protein ComE-like DNA-binding protein
MKYSLDSKVRLDKIVIGKTGNVYYPGIYSKGRPLEEKFMTSEHVTLLEGAVVEKEQVPTQPQVEHSKSSNFTPVEEFEIKNVNPKAVKIEEQNLTPRPIVEEKTEVKGLNINEATRKEITDLEGIGGSTAKKVIDLREIAPFVNYSDLNERVALAFGRDWKDFNLEF